MHHAMPHAGAPAVIIRDVEGEMADFMRLNPGCTQEDLAGEFTLEQIARHGAGARTRAARAWTRRIG